MNLANTKKEVYFGLTASGTALVVTLLFRLLFGGYLIGKDQFDYFDIESALTVLLINGLLCIFSALFLLGNKYGLIGVMGLSVFPIVAQSIFIILTLGPTQLDAGLHDPLENLWIILFNYLFSILTLIFSIKVYREISPRNPVHAVRALGTWCHNGACFMPFLTIQRQTAIINI